MKHCTGCWRIQAITSDRSSISSSPFEEANGSLYPFLMANRTNTTGTRRGNGRLNEFVFKTKNSRGLNGFNGWARSKAVRCAHPLNPFNPRLFFVLKTPSRLDRAIQHDFEGRAGFQDEIFPACQQNRGSAGSSSAGAADDSAFA